MNTQEKIAQIKARNFTCVTVWCETEDGEYVPPKTIIVLTGSKPVARAAVEQIIKDEGWHTRPYHAESQYPSDQQHFTLYPRMYVRKAISITSTNPERVYAVEQKVITSASA